MLDRFKKNKLNIIKKSSKWVQSGWCILNRLEITSENVKDVHFQNQENIKDSRMQKLLTALNQHISASRAASTI